MKPPPRIPPPAAANSATPPASGAGRSAARMSSPSRTGPTRRAETLPAEIPAPALVPHVVPAPPSLGQTYMQALETATVGLPFAAFKGIAGWHLYAQSGSQMTGLSLMALGLTDAMLNVGNILSLSFLRRRWLPVCVIDAAVHSATQIDSATPKMRSFAEIGLALDVAVSFAIVALMLGLDRLPLLPRGALHLWSLAVVLNVIGAGIARLAQSWPKPPEKTA